MAALTITYRTPTGIRAPLRSLFYCTACAEAGATCGAAENALRSAHPLDAIQELESFYCPHTLEQYTTQEAEDHMQRSRKAFDCPCCGAILAFVDVGGAGGDAPSGDAVPRIIFKCQFCGWDSVGAGSGGWSAPNRSNRRGSAAGSGKGRD